MQEAERRSAIGDGPPEEAIASGRTNNKCKVINEGSKSLINEGRLVTTTQAHGLEPHMEMVVAFAHKKVKF